MSDLESEGDNGLTEWFNEWINGAMVLDMIEGKLQTEQRDMDPLT